MIIASPILGLKRISKTYRKIYNQQNGVYESCNDTKPSTKIRLKNAAKAIRTAIVIEIAKSMLV